VEEKDWFLLDILYVEKNVTRTAQRLYVSQPSITYRIRQIEQAFGTEIIVRRKTGVEFTPEGEHIALYARNMLLQLQKLKDKVANTGNATKGTLRLAVSSTFAHYQLPELLKAFLEQYPHVEINVKTGWSSDVLQSIQKEEVHMAVVRGDTQWQEQKQLLQTEPILIVSKVEVDEDQLPDLPRINYKTDFALNVVIDNWWQSTYKTLPPFTTMEVDNIQTCKELVKQGLGYAILPAICLQNNDRLYTKPLTSPEGEPITRNTWLICRNGLLELSTVRAFVDFARSYFQASNK
jgi:DNA-binding transcriptional LysR family regulator